MIIPPVGERVLSRFGWGTVQEASEQYVSVRLDRQFAGSIRLGGRPEEFIVPTEYAVIRILNVAGRGIIGIATFVPESLIDACFTAMPKAQNETRFLLTLASSTYEQSDPFGILIEERYVLLAAWADRWAIMDAVPPNLDLSPEHLLDAIHDLEERMHSVGSGIAYYTVLDTETQAVVWHAFLCETGWIAHPAGRGAMQTRLGEGPRQLPESTE